jgi:uncharacterized protein (DUF1330 family)
VVRDLFVRETVVAGPFVFLRQKQKFGRNEQFLFIFRKAFVCVGECLFAQTYRRNEPMKANHKLAFAVLVGVAIGIAGAAAVHARQVNVAPGYLIAEIAVTDPNSTSLQKYAQEAPKTMAPFNHRYLVRGGKTQALEGEPPTSIVVIAFDSAEKAREWYDSPAYQAIKPLRQSATKSRLFIAEGIAPE